MQILCSTSLRHPPSDSPLIKLCRSIPSRYASLLFLRRLRTHVAGPRALAHIAPQDCSPSPNTTRRPYVCPPLWVHRPSVPQHWDLASGDKHLDISEEDGYVLSANGEGPTQGAVVPCEPLSAVRRARPGRLRINKPWILHRRRVSGITTSSPTNQIVSSVLSLLRLIIPPPSTYRSINLLTINLSPSLPPAYASAIAFPTLPRRPTRTSRTCSIASVSAMPSPSPPQRRHHRTPPFHLTLHPRCRARPRLYASSSDPSSTCRRVLPWERAPHLPHQRYPPPVLAPPHSGPLDGFRSAHPSRFGPQNTTLVPSWFDKSDQQGFLFLAILNMGAFVFRRFSISLYVSALLYPFLLYPRCCMY